MEDKVLIDTSVWIDFFKGTSEQTIQTVSDLLKKRRVLLTGIVLFELLQGTKDKKEAQKISSLLAPLDRFDPDASFWEEAGLEANRLRQKGVSSPTLDLILALIATHAGASILSHDKHFQILTQHLPLKLYPITS